MPFGAITVCAEFFEEIPFINSVFDKVGSTRFSIPEGVDFRNNRFGLHRFLYMYRFAFTDWFMPRGARQTRASRIAALDCEDKSDPDLSCLKSTTQNTIQGNLGHHITFSDLKPYFSLAIRLLSMHAISHACGREPILLNSAGAAVLTPVNSLKILGVPVACATYASALEQVKKLACEPRPTAVCPANTHILAEARHNPGFAQVMAKFDLVLPDGMPVVWTLNRLGAGLSHRVYGPYFMRHTLQNTPHPWRHFFWGDTADCLAELRRVATQLQPDIEIVGAISPPFRPLTEEDEASFAQAINQAAPDFIWVALPGVRMERWIIHNQARYQRGVFLAVGDAFSLLTGRRRFAPAWMQRLGMTWVFRLCSEPGRLAARYFKYNFLFVFYLLWDGLRGRASAPTDRVAE